MSRPVGRTAPGLDGALTSAQVSATVTAIAACQRPDGSVPWFPGGRTDPWDHVESAMALDAGGRHAEATAAYQWLADAQRPDGAWASWYQEGRVLDATTQSHHAAYVAVGVWHHTLATGDETFLADMWPMVRRALDWVIHLAAGDGRVWWARSPAGTVDEVALTTGCASVHQGLLAGVAIASRLGHRAVAWAQAATALAHTLVAHPDLFADRSRYSMDWYYPVLGGALTGPAAWDHLTSRWGEFVHADLGARCVSDRPWVTGAETCELALAAHAAGRPDAAAGLVTAMQHLRHQDGSYWTGLSVPDGVRWPVERTTWTGAAVVLAVDALAGRGPHSAIFAGPVLPGSGHAEPGLSCPTCSAAAATRSLAAR